MLKLLMALLCTAASTQKSLQHHHCCYHSPNHNSDYVKCNKDIYDNTICIFENTDTEDNVFNSQHDNEDIQKLIDFNNFIEKLRISETKFSRDKVKLEKYPEPTFWPKSQNGVTEKLFWGLPITSRPKEVKKCKVGKESGEKKCRQKKLSTINNENVHDKLQLNIIEPLILKLTKPLQHNKGTPLFESGINKKYKSTQVPRIISQLDNDDDDEGGRINFINYPWWWSYDGEPSW